VRHQRALISAASVAVCVVATVGSTASAQPSSQGAGKVAGLQSRQEPGARDAGAASGPKAVSLVLGSRDESGLNAYVAGPHRPLSAQEFAARFGPSPEAVGRVQGWAATHGLKTQRDPNSQLVQVSGTAQQVSSAFSTSMHNYHAGNQSYVAANGPGTLPSDVAAVTAGVVGLSAPSKAQLASSPAASGPPAATQAATGYGPADLTKFYNAPTSATGKGQALSIIGEGDLTQVGKDLTAFEQKFNLPQVPLNVIKVDGSSSDTQGQVEWDLDTQYSTGFAPDVSAINFYTGPGLDDKSLLDTSSKWVDDNKTKQASESLGECETDAQQSGFLASQDEILKKADAQGQTLFVSSGDTGSKCGTQNGVVSGPKGVSYPASSPYVVGVGGTTITDAANHQEVGWNASGGGQSSNEQAAPWQSNAGGSFQPSSRGVPDVSLDSDTASGYQIISNGVPMTIGGTSADAPSWNGIWARAEQQNQSQLGFGAALLYRLPTSAFNDITQGNNGDYNANPGWDYVTGRGTPNISALVSQIHP
jgi:pseudomonalisin